MTGTAFTEAKEFEEVYKLKAVAGPMDRDPSWAKLGLSHQNVRILARATWISHVT